MNKSNKFSAKARDTRFAWYASIARRIRALCSRASPTTRSTVLTNSCRGSSPISFAQTPENPKRLSRRCSCSACRPSDRQRDIRTLRLNALSVRMAALGQFECLFRVDFRSSSSGNCSHPSTAAHRRLNGSYILENGRSSEQSGECRFGVYLAFRRAFFACHLRRAQSTLTRAAYSVGLLACMARSCIVWPTSLCHPRFHDASKSVDSESVALNFSLYFSMRSADMPQNSCAKCALWLATLALAPSKSSRALAEAAKKAQKTTVAATILRPLDEYIPDTIIPSVLRQQLAQLRELAATISRW